MHQQQAPSIYSMQQPAVEVPMFKEEHDLEKDDEEEADISWANIIFLPFYLWWEALIAIIVCVKCVFAPLTAVDAPVFCNKASLDLVGHVVIVYSYIGDTLYAIDIVLQIIHRQVSDEAKKKEFKPRHACLIVIDIICLIPFYELLAKRDRCRHTRSLEIWPNIMAFTEILCIYRIANIFSLYSTHSYIKLIMGYVIILLLMLNALTCLFLLITYNGLCEDCNLNKYDWRGSFKTLNYADANNTFHVYFYALAIISSRIVNDPFTKTIPQTYIEYLCEFFILIFMYFLREFIIVPKVFSECTYHLTKMFSFHYRAKFIIAETKRRNPLTLSHKTVENYYRMLWARQDCVTSMPKVINKLPLCIRRNIYQDLMWPVFYHSPTLRNTSSSFKRWISSKIDLCIKLPQERLYEGAHCYTDLYYIKSGIVQIISVEDSNAPVLSVTSGTILGDVNFLVPHTNRKVIVRCLTHCEIFTISRTHLLMGLQIFPQDSRFIKGLVRGRLQHARDLFKCKNAIRGTDRAEDEGLAYIKRRWWVISETVHRWQQSSEKKRKCEIPPEENEYHCSKYIGQLVLCDSIKIQLKSPFTKETFPWILAPHSNFSFAWYRTVLIIVFISLIILPPYMARQPMTNSKWFHNFLMIIDIIYAVDVLISLVTARVGYEHETRLSAVMFERCCTTYFILDALSLSCVPHFVTMITSNQKYDQIVQYCRLIKTYMLFVEKYKKKWAKGQDPLRRIFFLAAVLYACLYYVISFIVYCYVRLTPGLEVDYYFIGPACVKSDKCFKTEENYKDISNLGVFSIPLGYWLTDLFPKSMKMSQSSIYDYGMHLILDLVYQSVFFGLNGLIMAAVYLHYEEKFRYKIIATKILKYYKHLNVHPDLLTRLKRYLEFHWKYFNGIDILHQKWLKKEPYDIYWKFHGSVAEKAISESKAFKGADFGLIRALAQESKFTKYPKNSTLILFGYPIEDVFWLINGTVQNVFQNEKLQTVYQYIPYGNMLAVGGIFFELPAHRSFFAATDCEVLSLHRQDFFDILKKHPDEWYIFEKCINELKSSYTRVYQEYMSKHESYELAMRDQIYHAKYLIQEEKEEFQKRIPAALEKSKTQATKFLRYFKQFRTHPESRATFHWMTLRAIIVVISITATAIQSGVTALWFNRLENLKIICDVFASFDIIIKTFMPYYDSKGIIVTETSKCTKHYMSRGFGMDIIGVTLGRSILIKFILSEVRFELARNLEIFLRFSHLYLLTGYFDYLADSPLTSSIIISFIKCQLVLILAGMSVAVVLLNTCVRYQFEEKNVKSISFFPKTCFISNHHYIDDDAELNMSHTQTLYMASVEFAEGMFQKDYFGNFNVFDWPNTLISVVTLNFVYVYYYFFCMVLLIATFRSTSVYQDRIDQLIRFLKSERVDESIIDKTSKYFMYHWTRTEGADDAHLLNSTIGTMLSQDLTHYFYYDTLGIADTLLCGGEIMQRQLASSVQMVVFSPGIDITREMDLCQHVYFVHKGHVKVLKNKEVTSLKKGSVFGLLDGKRPRAARNTMQSVDYVDLLQIPAHIFQEYINDVVRENIVRIESYKEDYLAVQMDVPESPTDSIQYILRGLKTIQLPLMKESVTTETSKWFSRWLLLVWVINPILSNVLSYASFTIRVEPDTRRIIGVIFKILPVLDAIHLIFMISEFFTLETVVIKDRCIQKYIRWKQLKNWERYLDVVSLVLPLFTYIDKNGTGHGWANVFRIYYIYKYRIEMSKTIYKKKANPRMFNIVLALLSLYLCNCMWKYIACDRSENIKFPLFPQGYEWDKNEWQHPFSFANGTCTVSKKWDKKTGEMIFVVAKDWRIDYILPLIYGLTMFVGYDDNFMFSFNLKHIYGKVILWYILNLISLFLISTFITIMYAKYQAKNVFDFKIATLLHFMQRNNASKLLIEMTKNYTNRMWQRTKGHWLPTLAQEAPLCFREDLFGALYMHHLQRPLLFQKLPDYILRQLVVRLKRTVIFPGHWVVKQGDNVSLIYFIHEGDVEKWTLDETGNSKMLALLSTNSYFGLMPGLFPDIAYTYSYYTRSIVDFMYLEYTSWIELINGYPDVKREFYDAAKNMSKNFAKA